MWFNVEVFETQDPNRFWVECHGEGQIIFPGYEVGHFDNPLPSYFRLENGTIKEQGKFRSMNRVMLMRTLGIEVPKINRGEILAD